MVREKMQYIYIVNTLQNSFFNKLLIRATISEAFLGLATSFYRITPFIIIINYSVLFRFWPLRKRLMGCNHYCKILFFTEVFMCSKVISALGIWKLSDEIKHNICVKFVLILPYSLHWDNNFQIYCWPVVPNLWT